MDYIIDVINMMSENTSLVVNDWETYKTTFISSTENTATSAVNLMINDFLYYYEKGFRANKIGIPAGVFSSSPIPENVEGYYSKIHSKTYAINSYAAIKNFYNGIKHTGGGYSGSSIKSIVMDLDGRTGDENLANKITNKMETASNLIDGLDENFVNQILTDNIKFLRTYDAIQEVVVLLKVDMLQLLNINVDYVDADGD